MQIKHRSQLPELMRHYNLPMIAVEIGVAQGLHSEDLLNNGIEKLYLVDIWENIKKQKGDGSSPKEWHDRNFFEVKKRIKPFGDRAVLLKGFSVDMANRVPDNSLGLVYIDGDHSYTGVMSDLIAWFPKLVKGGIMAGHDYLMPEYGVSKAVHDFVSALPGYNSIDNIITIPENKKEDSGFWYQKL